MEGCFKGEQGGEQIGGKGNGRRVVGRRDEREKERKGGKSRMGGRREDERGVVERKRRLN